MTKRYAAFDLTVIMQTLALRNADRALARICDDQRMIDRTESLLERIAPTGAFGLDDISSLDIALYDIVPRLTHDLTVLEGLPGIYSTITAPAVADENGVGRTDALVECHQAIATFVLSHDHPECRAHTGVRDIRWMACATLAARDQAISEWTNEVRKSDAEQAAVASGALAATG